MHIRYCLRQTSILIFICSFFVACDGSKPNTQAGGKTDGSGGTGGYGGESSPGAGNRPGGGGSGNRPGGGDGGDMPPDMSGQEGEACRDEEPRCDGTLICQNNICTDPAGQEDAECRANNPRCNLGLQCQNNVCRPNHSGGLEEACRQRAPLCNPGLICGDNQRCMLNPACPENSCIFGEQICANANDEGISVGVHICGESLVENPTCTELGTDPEDPIIIECRENRICENNTCIGDENQKADIGFVVDRGGFDENTWPEWRDAILFWSRNTQPTYALGGMTFPVADDASGCTTNFVQARSSRDEIDGLAALFDLPQPRTEARPLHGAIGRSIQLTGRPSENQVAVLITFGGETCNDPQDFVHRVSRLRGRGLLTRILRIVLDGNDGEVIEDLHAAGILGGLSKEDDDGIGYTNVHSPEELLAELEALSRFLNPQGCLDSDRDGFGYLCPDGLDCDDGIADINPEVEVELCNGRDDDCDAQIDEQDDLEPVPPEELGLSDFGVCKNLLPQCVDGQWQEQDYSALDTYLDEEAGAANCDEFDNDCDGNLDENTVAGAGSRCSEGQGICSKSGIGQCFAGAPGILLCANNGQVIQAGEPEPEISLDNLDNDCDGNVDEVHPNCGDQVGIPCDVGQGPCEVRGGTYHCEVDVNGNAGQLVCLDRNSLEPLRPLEPEGEMLEDGIDNDCDGQVDERSCVGDDPEMDRVLCGATPEQVLLDCVNEDCVLACNDEFRNGPVAPEDEGRLLCQTPGAYTQLALGREMTCFIEPETRNAFCYGGPNDDHAPTINNPIGPYKKIAAAGRHVCLLPEGEGPQQAICFGPDADFISRIPNTEFIDIAVGEYIGTDQATACGLTLGGVVECWSSIEENRGVRQVPAPAPDFDGESATQYTQVSVGGQHICMLDDLGKVTCWGECGPGECEGQSDAPQESGFAQISAGSYHTCGLGNAGNVFCWGAGTRENDECGTCFEQSNHPLVISGFRKISAGGLHSCAIDENFEIQCWGRIFFNPPSGQFMDIWSGSEHSCARRIDGSVQCWGNNTGGEADDFN